MSFLNALSMRMCVSLQCGPQSPAVIAMATEGSARPGCTPSIALFLHLDTRPVVSDRLAGLSRTSAGIVDDAARTVQVNRANAIGAQAPMDGC